MLLATTRSCCLKAVAACMGPINALASEFLAGA